MNLNLLPQQHKEAIRHEIFLRAILLIAIFFIVWTIFFSILISQSVVFLSIQNAALKERVEIEERAEVTQEALGFEQIINNANESLRHISKITQEPDDDVATLLQVISALMPPGAVLGTFQLNSTSSSLTLGGHAQTRQQVLALESSLKAQTEYFVGVEAPITNLLKPLDVSFSFTLTLKSQGR